MRNPKHVFVLNTLVAALLAVYGTAMAADDPELEELVTPESWVSIGAGALFGDDRRQLGIIGGLRDTEPYLLLDADINRRDDATGTWQSFQASNLGMNSRELRAEIQQQGNHGLAFEYRQSQREVPYLVNTGVTGIGTANQVVPNPGIAPGTGTDYQLGTERSKYGLDFFKFLNPRLKFKIGASNEDKEGDRMGRVGGQPEFAATPIDWHVRKLDAVLDYVGDNMQLSGGYNGSKFINDKDLLTAVRGATSYYISQPLDSTLHRFYLDGGYGFSPTTRGTFKLSYSHATQDEHIPTADIPGLANPAAPTHLDGEINTTLAQLGITARPTPALSLLANVRYHNVDDNTPAAQIVFGGTSVHSTPLSYETLTGKLEGTYRLPSSFNLIAGIDYSDQDRTVPLGTLNVTDEDTERYVPFRAELQETTYRLQLRRSMSESLNGAIAFLHSERDGSDYAEALHSEPGEGIHPEAIDPINIADRDRNKWRLSMDWVPTDALNLQFNYENAKDEYSGHTYGLRDGKAWLFSVDASYAISKDWQVTSWYSHDVTEANQLNYRWASGTYSAAEMDTNLEDIGKSLGIGLKGLVTPKLKIGADLQWTRTNNNYQQSLTQIGAGTLYDDPAGALTSGPVDDIKSTLISLKLYGEYALKKNAELRVDLIHERWKTDDWTWQFLDGTPFTFNDGTTIYTEPKQNSTFLGFRYKYKL